MINCNRRLAVPAALLPIKHGVVSEVPSMPTMHAVRRARADYPAILAAVAIL